MKPLLIGCVALLVLHGCIGTTHAAAGGIEGCYKVTSQALKKNSKLRVEPDMRLVARTTWTPWGTFHQALERTPGGGFKDTGGHWTLEKAKLKIAWSNNGLSGFEIIVQPKGRRYEGFAQDFWDFDPYVTKKKIIFLTRIRCGSNP